MRQIALDTETTGIDLSAGNRIVEIGCIEICQRVPSGRTFHAYLNPDRDSEPGALAVHGLTREFLADKPRFADVVDDLLAFVDGAELLVHNANFDLGFLNSELARAGRDLRLEKLCPVLDTIALARELHPGQRNSLDALCKRYGVDNSGRSFHGALLDARLLVDVYLAMTAGQGSLELSPEPAMAAALLVSSNLALRLPLRRAHAAECELHLQRLQAIEAKNGRPALYRLWMDPAEAD